MYISQRLSWTFNFLAIYVVRCAVADPEVTWLWPDDSKVQSYSPRDILNASWITTLTMMPTLLSLCREGSPTSESANISYSWVHSIGSKLIPLDLWSGPNLPYKCYLDLIDGSTDLQLNQPSNSFYITGAVSDSSPKIWSEGSASQAVQQVSSVSSSASTSSSQTVEPTTPSTPVGVQDSSSATSLSSSRTSRRKSGTGISVGGIVGIVIASLIGGGLIAVAATYLWLRNRRNQQTEIPDQSYHQPPPHMNPVFVGYAEKDAQAPATHEIEGRTFTELDVGPGLFRGKRV